MTKSAIASGFAKVSAWTLAATYLAQHVTAPPNSTEGGVVFNYVHRIATGQRVYVDLFDLYGPVTWYLPSLFYGLAGKTVIGIRIYLLLLKLATVWVCHGLVRRLAGAFWAALAAATVTILVGLPWASFQTPYAAHLSVPLAVGTWWLVLSARGGSSNARLAVAALLTAAGIWTKITSGGFVFAAVAFYLFFWDETPPGGEVSRPVANAFRAIQIAALVAYLVLFNAFIRQHLNVLFFLYLSLPLAGILAWTLRHVLREWRDGTRVLGRLRSTGTYVLLTGFFCVAYLFAYFRSSSFDYLRDELRMLRVISYEKPFPPIGKPGAYVGFNEWLWPELPLLTSAIFFLALGLGWTRGSPGDRASLELCSLGRTDRDRQGRNEPREKPAKHPSGCSAAAPAPAALEVALDARLFDGYRIESEVEKSARSAEKARVSSARSAEHEASTARNEGVLVGLAMMTTLEGFVIYSRAGEPQLIQAIVPSAAALFVFAAHLERLVPARVWVRPVVAASVALGLSTIFCVPLPGSYTLGKGDWTSPRLVGLRYHPRHVPYFTVHRPGERYDLLDASLDSAANQIASLTTKGEAVLVLGPTELLNYASETEPVGGRYAPLFYFVRLGTLNREGFLSLLPSAEYQKLLADPPRIVVSEDERDILAERLPELATSIRMKNYREVGRHGFLTILQRQQESAQSKNE